MIHAGSKRFFVLPYDQIQMPFPGQAVSIFDHGRDLITRVHMKQREGDMAEKGLPRQPQEHSRIFSHRPEHREVVEMLVGFPQNVDALIFELAEVFHRYSLCRKFRPAATGVWLKASSFLAAAPFSITRRARGIQSANEGPLPAA